MTPRWTYTEANASRWRPLFDDLLDGAPSLEVPLEGNAKSLCSLKIRICDALKWLADGFHKRHNPSMKPYALLKPQMRYEAHADALILHLRKHPILYRDYLAHSTLDRLDSTLQRPDISDDFRAQIRGILSNYSKDLQSRDSSVAIARSPKKPTSPLNSTLPSSSRPSPSSPQT